jgi:hypothetical protein
LGTLGKCRMENPDMARAGALTNVSMRRLANCESANCFRSWSSRSPRRSARIMQTAA